MKPEHRIFAAARIFVFFGTVEHHPKTGIFLVILFWLLTKIRVARCISLIMQLALTSNMRALSRRDCPARTARTMRSRKSCALGGPNHRADRVWIAQRNNRYP